MKILMTSFDRWLPEQSFNSSEVIVKKFEQEHLFLNQIKYIHSLPVDGEGAWKLIQPQLNPDLDLVLLTGMARGSKNLRIEKKARKGETFYHSGLNLSDFLPELKNSELSVDCGQFVCNQTYFKVLEFLFSEGRETHCLFLHIPEIVEPYWEDFKKIMDHLDSGGGR